MMKCWPFLIAGGRYEDYDFVMAPEFLANAVARDIWRKPEFHATQPSSDVRTFSADHPSGGKIFFCYRTQRVTGDGNELRDPSGRPIYQSFGLVSRESDFDKVVAPLLPVFRSATQRYLDYRAPPVWAPQVTNAVVPRSPPPHRNFKSLSLVASLVAAASIAANLLLARTVMEQRAELNIDAAKIEAQQKQLGAKEGEAVPNK
jgi:hypothetical protein